MISLPFSDCIKIRHPSLDRLRTKTKYLISNTHPDPFVVSLSSHERTCGTGSRCGNGRPILSEVEGVG